jgi:hypothetical protein
MRYRLYIDESGDHRFKQLTDEPGRFLCLLGCFFSQENDYLDFHKDLEDFKQRHIPHNPDEPVILHRKDIINARGCFWRLRDPKARQVFDVDLLAVCAAARFRMVGVVIDKFELLRFPTPAHPYNLALGFLLQRYCGYLNHFGHEGDVLAESRGGKEDRDLRASFDLHYARGAWMVKAATFQRALTSGQLKLKKKSANIAGLQLCDILAHPVKRHILLKEGVTSQPLGRFSQSLIRAVSPRFNRHLYSGRIEGYGTVFYPTPKQK